MTTILTVVLRKLSQLMGRQRQVSPYEAYAAHALNYQIEQQQHEQVRWW